MKKQVVILLSVLASVFAFTACEGGAQSTPEIHYAGKVIRTTAEGQRDTVLFTDTFHIGDTIRWNMVAYGVYNPLKYFIVSTDTSKLGLSILADPGDSVAFAAGTDLEHAQIYFKPQFVMIWGGWLRIIPHQSGTHDISLTIANEAGKDFSPRTYSTAIKVK